MHWFRRRVRAGGHRGFLLAAAFFGTVLTHDAACPPPGTADPLWTATLAGPGTTSAAANDTFFRPSNLAPGSVSYLTHGTTVYAIRNVAMDGMPAGSIRWTRSFAGVNVQNFPSPVPVKTATSPPHDFVIYFAASDGFLYALNADDGTDYTWTSIDTRRSGCASDTLLATPAVQLWDYSNAAFRDNHQDGGVGYDVVFVITRAMCDVDPDCTGCDQENRILAFNARTGVPIWTFDPNDLGLPMSYGSEGCSIDYENNLLYCGTNSVGGQDSLWAVRTAPDSCCAAGTRKWSAAVGSIRNRPMRRGANVYVGTYAGALRAHDALTGVQVFVANVTGGASVTRNPFPEFRVYTSSIYMTSSDGFFHKRIEDLGAVCAYPHACKAAGAGGNWPVDGVMQLDAPVVTMPALSPTNGKAYVGLGNGKIWQIDMGTGAEETWGNVTFPASGTVFDPTLDVEGDSSDVNRIEVAVGSGVRRFCGPWVFAMNGTSFAESGSGYEPLASCPPSAGFSCLSDADCGCWQDVCSASRCVQGVCTRVPQNDYAACDDGLPQTCAQPDSQGECPGVACSYPDCQLCGCQPCLDGSPQCCCDQCKDASCFGPVSSGGSCAETQDANFPDRNCPAGQACCRLPTGDAGCRSVLTDPSNCGGCGYGCSSDEPGAPFCVNGACCPVNCTGAGQSCCNAAGSPSAFCASLLTDRANCGACGNVCSPDRPNCSGGVCCTQACLVGQTCCPAGATGDACVDLLNDPKNCGACGNDCTANGQAFCRNGRCCQQPPGENCNCPPPGPPC